ncbi:hypothetical protein V1478_016847 [Vespula squamosa]|uniref:Uncharacterized protein n=1 Tax=Vespula squamosa TaxID=30214 RepID=A0ABD2A3L6_VESSQ
MPIFGCTKEDNCRRNAYLRARERANREKERKKLENLNNPNQTSKLSKVENVDKDIVEQNVKSNPKKEKETSESERGIDDLEELSSSVSNPAFIEQMPEES